MASMPTSEPGTAPTAPPPPTDVRPDDRGQQDRLDALDARLTAASNRFRDMEKSLVERIADVDDDRRLASVQMQRGWQTLREELDGRLGRLGLGLGLGLALGLALAAAALVAMYLHQQTALAGLSAEVQTLRGELARVPAAGTPPAAATAPTAPDAAPAQPAAATARDNASELAAQLETLAASHQRLADEVATLRQDLEAVPAGNLPPPLAAAPAPSLEPTTTLAADAPRTRPAAAGQVTVSDQPFALQLMGSSDRQQLLDWIASVRLPQPVYLRQEVLRGRPWLVLIHSLHGNQQAARAALGQLTPAQRSHSPWVRKLTPGTSLEVLTGTGQP